MRRRTQAASASVSRVATGEAKPGQIEHMEHSQHWHNYMCLFSHAATLGIHGLPGQQLSDCLPIGQ